MDIWEGVERRTSIRREEDRQKCAFCDERFGNIRGCIETMKRRIDKDNEDYRDDLKIVWTGIEKRVTVKTLSILIGVLIVVLTGVGTVTSIQTKVMYDQIQEIKPAINSMRGNIENQLIEIKLKQKEIATNQVNIQSRISVLENGQDELRKEIGNHQKERVR